MHACMDLYEYMCVCMYVCMYVCRQEWHCDGYRFSLYHDGIARLFTRQYVDMYAWPCTAILKIIQAQFQIFPGFLSCKLVLKTVKSRFAALNDYGNGSMWKWFLFGGIKLAWAWSWSWSWSWSWAWSWACVCVQYCHSHNNWRPLSRFQRFSSSKLVLKTVERW